MPSRAVLACLFSARCWRCGQEILAELDAVEAHEEPGAPVEFKRQRFVGQEMWKYPWQ